jgi:hypothetical protein
MSEFGDLPVVEGVWVRPSAAVPAEPRWGHAHGLQIGLAPLPGPRGLIRIYTPYLDHPRERLVNFVAIEPTPVGATERGFSELEPSSLDPGERGKRFWSFSPSTPPALPPAGPQLASAPDRGVVDSVDGVSRLTVYIGCERFDNGADVYVRARFRSDAPHEVALAAFRRPTSVPLKRVALSATMGNWARLRELRLADRVVTPGELWPGFGGDGFTPHARFGLSSLARDSSGAAVVSAVPDEESPAAVSYAPGTHEHWHFIGRRAVQGWRAPNPRPGLEVLVNGRFCYWASESPIPGGTSFENFELGEPFVDGQEYFFSVEPLD